MTYREAKKLKVGDPVLTNDHHYIHLHVAEIEHDEEHRDIFFRCSDRATYHHTALLLPMSVDEIAERFLRDPSTRVWINYNDQLAEWLYSVEVVDSDEFWLSSFKTEEEAEEYIAEHGLKKASPHRTAI